MMDSLNTQSGPCLSLRSDARGLTATGTLKGYWGLRSEECVRPDVPFVQWRWHNGSLHLANDRYGFFPVFYTILEHDQGQELLLSPSLLTLLRRGARRDLDWRALAAFLRLSDFVGNDTPFRYIRMLPPSARIEVRNGRFCVEGSLPACREDSTLSREAALDGFVELLREAVGSMPADEAFVPLSGGRDSRHILLALLHHGMPRLRTLSIELEPCFASGDPEAATQLAKALGVEHEVSRVEGKPVEMERLKNLQTNWMTVEHRWLVPICARPQPPGVSIYEGVAGDTLSGSRFSTPELLRLLDAGKLREVASRLIPSEHYLALALPTEIYREASREAAIDRIIEEVNRYASEFDPLRSFRFFNRTRRTVSLNPCVLWRRGGPVWCPYLYAPLVDFLRSVPVSHRLGSVFNQFHTDAIRRGYPGTAHIPYASKNVVWTRAWAFNFRLALEMGRYVAPQPFRLLKRGFLLPRIARALADPSYSSSMSAMNAFVVYMTQIEALRDGRWDDL